MLRSRFQCLQTLVSGESESPMVQSRTRFKWSCVTRHRFLYIQCTPWNTVGRKSILKGMTVCKECVEEKHEIRDSYLPCLKYKEELDMREPTKIRELLCQVGPYQWCTKFCNMSDRQLELGFQKEFPRVIQVVEPLWNAGRL